MRLTEIHYPDTPPIDSYGPGFFRVDGEVIEGGLLVLPGLRRSWQGYDDVEAILAAASGFDVLFVGTGAEIAHPPMAFRRALEAAGVGIEPMITPSACRSFNIVLSEGRRIALAALPV